MKTLEENRYRKIVNADARRVSWLVNNNLAEDYESMPKSIRKKWPKAAYGRERYLAREYINSKSTEKKLRESIRKIIKKTMSEEDSSTRLNRDRRSAAKTDLIKAKAERERAKAAKDRAKAKQKSLHNN